jgi:predicted ATP-grasp superfamily ATP-dependent carboligase
MRDAKLREEAHGHMSTIGKITCFMVIKEENSVALSTAKAEYIPPVVVVHKFFG